MIRRLNPCVALLICLLAISVSARAGEPLGASIEVEFQAKDSIFMPSLDRLFVVGSTSMMPATSGASSGYLDRYVPGSLKRDRRVRICPGPQRLAADDANERLIVSCVRVHSSGPQQPADFETETLIVDARRLTIVATVPMAPVLGSAGFVLNRNSIVIKKDTDPDYVVVDATNGRPRSTVSAPGSYGANARFVAPRTRAQPVAAFDQSGDAVTLFSGDSIKHVFIGAGRLPLDAAFGDDVLYVVEWSAGALAIVDYTAGNVRRVVSAGFEASDVAFDDVERSAYVLSDSDDGSRCELHRFSATGDDERRYELDAAPCTDRLPPQFQSGPQHALVIDREARRLYALTKDAIVVFDLVRLRAIFTVQLGFGQDFVTTSVAFDIRRGVAYQTIEGEHGFVRRLPLGGHAAPIVVGTQPTITPEFPNALSFATLGPMLADRPVPVHEDEPGLRSPAAAALDRTGSLVVAESSSPTLSRFSHGAYETYDGPAVHSPASPAFDGLGNLWFEDVWDRSKVTLDVRTPDGAQRVFPIRDALVHVGGGAGALLPSFVTDERGGIWFGYSRTSFVHVLPDGNERECKPLLPRATLVTSLASGRDGIIFATTDAIGTLRDDCSIDWYATKIKIFASAIAQAPDGTIVTAGLDGVSIFPVSGHRRSISLFSLVKRTPLRPGPDVFPEICNPSEIVATAANVAWTLCNEQHEIERISFDGRRTAVALPDPSARPTSLVGGSDGSLWYVDTARSRIGHVTADGVLSETII